MPELRKTNGTIVYTSSGASTGAYSAWGAYVAAKAAINALARQIACEEDQVTAFAIRPGVVDTDMQRDLREIHSAVMDEKDNAKFLGAHENKTLLKPEQPGHIIAKLAIDPARDFNGQYLRSEHHRVYRALLTSEQLGQQRAFEVSRPDLTVSDNV